MLNFNYLLRVRGGSGFRLWLGFRLGLGLVRVREGLGFFKIDKINYIASIYIAVRTFQDFIDMNWRLKTLVI